MKLKVLLGPLALALLAATTLSAQTVVSTLKYDSADPVATVQGYQTTLKIGAAAAQTISPTCVAKSGPGFITECTAPVPGPVPSGTQYTLTLANATGLAATTITQGQGPASPTNVVITITVTVP